MTGRTLLRGGAVFDGDRHRPGHALVVEGDRVAVVLPEAELDPRPDDREVDLAGGLVAPGFVDAHVHPMQAGLERVRCDLSGGETRDDYLRTIAEYAAAQPDADWILGGGWAMAAFPGGCPTAADLDRVVADRPVLLPNRDHHGAWVNSRALELAGIHAGTPDPPDGRIERDAAGHPTGTLHEGAVELVARLLPPTTDAEHHRALLAAQAYLHSQGITGWQDAIIGDYLGMTDASPHYLRAARAGELTADVVGAMWWDRDRGPEQLAELVERRADLHHARFRPTSVKIMADGVAENGTAALAEPYLDRCGHPTDGRGHSFLDAAALREAVTGLHDAGFQVHVHAIGDRAATETLDAFAAVAGRPPADPGPHGHRDPRHHIAHLQLVRPADRARFAGLGVTANLQALWACLDDQMVDLTLPHLGPERASWQYPFADLHAAGARLACGSDWPVSTPDPLAAMHVAVNRTAYGASGREGSEPFLPEQALDLATVFAAYTAGSARINHRDDTGRLEPGAVADLVLLDRDPFAGPSDLIGATRVMATWVAGEPVFEA